MPSRNPGERVKILLVDDLKDNLLALEALLARDGLSILKARSGVEALELMVAHEFALALIDVQMPGMSGFELAELMRGTNRTKNVPIIFLTATAVGQSFSFKGYESGAVDFLLKPLDTHAVKSKVNIFVDLYVQKREFRSAERKFRGLLENAPDAIVIGNEQGNIELANKQAEVMFGYERSELIGMPLERLMPKRFRQGHVRLRTEYAEHPVPRAMGKGPDLFGVRKDGTEFSIEISISPLETEGSTLISAAIRDISARRASEKERDKLLSDLSKTQGELERAIQLRDEFMSIASHELKTPLTSLMLQTQLRMRKLLKGNASAFTLDRLSGMFDADEKQLGRITHLIDDMLDVSRISSGKLSLNLEQFDLCDLVRDVVGQSSDQFLAASCPIKVDFCPAAVGAWDHFRIEQVVVNLLTNAMRYAPGKAIAVRVSTSSEGARISVSDQGRGIAKEDHARIFQRFERGGVRNEISGLGLGLYIVTQILEAHGGSIRVESELGQGATFVVDLPPLEQKADCAAENKSQHNLSSPPRVQEAPFKC